MAVTDLDLGRYKLGWSDEEDYVFKPKKGLNEDIVHEMSWMKGEPDWMLKNRLKSLEHFQKRPMPNWGGDMSEIFFDDIYYYIKPTDRAGRRVGRAARLGQEHLREAGHPRGRAQVPRRRHRPVRVRGRLPPQPGGPRAPGRHLHRHGHGAARAPRAGQAVLRHDHPAERQQVRRAQHRGVVGRVVHLRAAGRRGRDAAAGLLPHQRREHGPVRAHADHRRRGLEGALHRGLLGPGVHHRLAALGGGRDRGQAQRPGHLHDHPELVEQRLQPGHQAGPGRGRGPHGVDRRQHRLAASP